MVKEYLEKIRNEIQEEKFSIIEQVNSCNNEIKEKNDVEENER